MWILHGNPLSANNVGGDGRRIGARSPGETLLTAKWRVQKTGESMCWQGWRGMGREVCHEIS